MRVRVRARVCGVRVRTCARLHACAQATGHGRARDARVSVQRGGASLQR